ncbi:hypothetical protein [Shewanella algae]|uniref:hypothetical protein n=1 Tax=Shewanella algae TaxID=38313 RepID=UPI0011875725|nr:hypothetical protein [Shewanella algae]TVO96297.1 hypothetical protein AYI86_13790 [Shewanella algae]
MNGNPHNTNNRGTVILQPDMLPLTLNAYASRTGQTLKAVQHQVASGFLPTMRIAGSKLIYVNQAQMVMSSLDAAGWNVITPSKKYSL